MALQSNDAADLRSDGEIVDLEIEVGIAFVLGVEPGTDAR